MKFPSKPQDILTCFLLASSALAVASGMGAIGIQILTEEGRRNLAAEFNPPAQSELASTSVPPTPIIIPMPSGRVMVLPN